MQPYPKFYLNFITVCLLLIPVYSYTQNAQPGIRGDIRIMFYNVENLFDTIDNPLTADEDFTPAGKLRWNTKRLNRKINNIYKVIAAASIDSPPEIVALSEIENREVLLRVVRNTPLSKFEYKIVHTDSPDERGIDVALIYRPDKLKMITTDVINVKFPSDPTDKTRDILYFSFNTGKKDTVHLFVNHWPSRSGGQLASETKRVYTAGVLKNRIDSIFRKNIHAYVIATGDFNDTPSDKSLYSKLGAKSPESTIKPGDLYNLSCQEKADSTTGTIKYKETWSIFDQMLVSGSLLNKGNLYTTPQSFTIFSPGFLLEKDEKYLGNRPFRTYNGYRYRGGYSDHLPVMLDLYFK